MKNGLTTGNSSVAATLCTPGSTPDTLNVDVIWGNLSDAIVAVGECRPAAAEYAAGGHV